MQERDYYKGTKLETEKYGTNADNGEKAYYILFCSVMCISFREDSAPSLKPGAVPLDHIK